jgi:hypothetical protein
MDFHGVSFEFVRVKKKYDEKQRLERECESVMSYDYRLWYI